MAGCAAAGLAGAQPASAATQTPPGTYAYVTDLNGGDVKVINTGTNSVFATIAVGGGPIGASVSADGKRVYVTNSLSNTVSVIDATTETVVATITVGTNPQAVALSPDGKRAFVANDVSGTVSIIDTATNSVTGSFTVGAHPEAIEFSPDGTHAYVSNLGSNSVSVVDTTSDSVVATVPVGSEPLGVGVTPDGAHVWVADVGNGTVSVIATADNSVTAISAGGSPYGVAISSDGQTVYITDRSGDQMRVISAATHSITASVATGRTPQQIALTPDGSRAYIADLSDNAVSVINLATQTAGTPIAVGNGPLGVAIGTIQRASTTLTAGPGHLSLLPLGVTGLNATLASNGTPLAGQTIAFTADDGTPLCQAVTNANGVATCSAVPPILTTVGVLLGGYQATFAGTTFFKPSSAHGSLQLLLTQRTGSLLPHPQRGAAAGQPRGHPPAGAPGAVRRGAISQDVGRHGRGDHARLGRSAQRCQSVMKSATVCVQRNADGSFVIGKEDRTHAEAIRTDADGLDRHHLAGEARTPGYGRERGTRHG